jgi:hypothetical protein
MALLWIDGFEGYGTSSVAGTTYRYESASTANDYINAGELTGYCLSQVGDSFVLLTPPLTQDPTLIAGCAFLATDSTAARWIRFYDNDVRGIGVKFNAAVPSTVTIQLGNNIINETILDTVLLANTWYYFEVKVFCHATSGSVEVRIDGETVVLLTGINTKAGTDSFYNKVQLSLQYCKVDNYYICDSVGGSLNDFLGPCRVIGIFANEDSTPLDWTPSSGTSHYALIDENPFSATDYLSVAVQGATDYFKYPKLVGNSTVLGIQISTTCTRSAGSSVIFQQPIEYNGQTALGPNTQVMGTDYTDVRHVSVVDPDTGEQWTIDKLADAKFGIRIV